MASPNVTQTLNNKIQKLQSQMEVIGQKNDQSLRVIEVLERQEQGIRELYEITSKQHVPFEDRIKGLLELGCRRFKLPLGVMTRLEGEKLYFEAAYSSQSNVELGEFVPVEAVYCYDILKTKSPVSFEHASQTAWKSHPGYATFRLEAYMGAPIIVTQEEPYGTLVFASHDPYQGIFTQADRDFLQLMARWIGTELERRSAEESLRSSEQGIRELYEITSKQHVPFEDRIKGLLELGCRRFKLPLGVMTRLEGDRLHFEATHSSQLNLQLGDSIPIEAAYCYDILKAKGPVSFEHASQSTWKSHPGYTTFQLKAYLGSPIIYAQEPYGTLVFASPDPYRGFFTEADRDFLQLMARWIGAELERRSAEKSLRTNEEAIRELYEITSASHRSFEDRMRSLLSLACRRFRLCHGMLTRWTGETLELVYLHSSDNTLVEGAIIPLCESFCGEVVHRDGPLGFEHAGNSPWRDHPGYAALKLEAYLGTKVQVGKEVFGTICFASSHPHLSVFSEGDKDFLQLMARWIGSELERQQAEDALRKSVERYNMAIEGSQDGLWEARGLPDKSGYPSDTSFWYSPRLKKMLDYQDHQFENTAESFYSHLHPDDKDRVLEAIWAHVQKKSPYDLEYRLRTKDGTFKWFSARGQATWDQSGNPIGMAGSLRDITQQKQLEAHLRQSQKLEAVGTLASGVAHDFNNILMAILGFTQLALATPPGNPKIRHHLEEILVGSERAKHLVQQILMFTRQTAPERKPIQLQPILQESVGLLRASLPSNIEIRSRFETESTVLLGDTTQLHQVMMNLGMNAEFAMRKTGGVLEIHSEEIQPSDEFFATHLGLSSGPYVSLTIRDTGAGIAPNILPRIFDPFYTTKGVGEGTGMGLAAVHGIVSSHGGVVKVDSQLERGTTFTIYFPLLQSHLSDCEQPKDLEINLPRGQGEILFVDDEDSLARLGKELLESLGYRATAITDPVEAVKLVRQSPKRFKAIITDQTMPKLTGEEIVSRLLHLNPKLPILVCTGFSHNMNLEKARALGAAAFLMKPVQKEELATTLAEVLSVSKEMK